MINTKNKFVNDLQKKTDKHSNLASLVLLLALSFHGLFEGIAIGLAVN